MTRVLYWLALPFVLLAMLVVPLFGGHFCIQEALPVLGVAASLPFVGTFFARWLKLGRKTHCCDGNHTAYRVQPARDEQGRITIEARAVRLHNFCEYENCDQERVPGKDLCQSHLDFNARIDAEQRCGGCGYIMDAGNPPVGDACMRCMAHDDPRCDFDGRYHYRLPTQPCGCKCHKPRPTT